MKIIVKRKNGDIGVYSTAGETAITSDSIRSASEQGRAFAVALEPRLSLLKTEGLVVDVFWYSTQTKDSHGQRLSPEFPRPEYGEDFKLVSTLFRDAFVWRIFDAEEIDDVTEITIEGLLNLRRVGPDLVNMSRFKDYSAFWLSPEDREASVAEVVLTLHDLISSSNPNLTDAQIAERYGFTEAAYKYLKKRVEIVDEEYPQASVGEQAQVERESAVIIVRSMIQDDPGLTLVEAERQASDYGLSPRDVRRAWKEAFTSTHEEEETAASVVEDSEGYGREKRDSEEYRVEEREREREFHKKE